jgi:hypothetical protein
MVTSPSHDEAKCVKKGTKNLRDILAYNYRCLNEARMMTSSSKCLEDVIFIISALYQVVPVTGSASTRVPGMR